MPKQIMQINVKVVTKYLHYIYNYIGLQLKLVMYTGTLQVNIKSLYHRRDINVL